MKAFRYFWEFSGFNSNVPRDASLANSTIMSVAKLLQSVPFRVYIRNSHTHSKSIHSIPKANENTSCNKNLLLYNYIKKSNSNKHYLLLPDVFNYWLKVPQDKLLAIRDALDYLLQGVILLDDVQDGTQFRRNLPSANRIYGAPWAVTASTFCFVAALQKLARLRNQAAVDVYCESLMSALDGIALDVFWRDTFMCPTEDEYMEMIKKKISSYFLLNIGVVQAFSEDRRDYRQLVNSYGLYYQIRDDYANLVNVQALDTKSAEQEFRNLHHLMFCEDVTEGNFSFPIIHGLNSSEGPTIRSILVQRTDERKIKEHCLSLLEKVGSLDYTRQTLQKLDADLRDQIHRLGGNPKLVALLDELKNWNG